MGNVHLFAVEIHLFAMYFASCLNEKEFLFSNCHIYVYGNEFLTENALFKLPCSNCLVQIA